MAHVLRDVAESDLDAFYEHQREPEATEMALFPARDREAFDAHWQRILADDSLIKKTIVHDGQVAGNIGCWEQDGRRLIGYWVGKEFWGRGLATRALAEFVEDLRGPSTRGWQEATSARSACSRSAASSPWAHAPSTTRTSAGRSRRPSTSSPSEARDSRKQVVV